MDTIWGWYMMDEVTCGHYMGLVYDGEVTCGHYMGLVYER